jgi:hypothetical protein
MSNRDKVRERIAKIINNAEYEDGIGIAWKDTTEYEKGQAYDKADQILADPDIFIKAENQELPETFLGEGKI